MAVARNEQLSSVANPNLPLAEEVYSRYYQDQLNSVLRLYFNRLNGNVNSLIGPNGGQFIDCPNGLFFDLGTYSPALVNTGYPLEFKQTYLGNAISVVDDTKITVAIGGVYNFQYSSAVTSTNASLKTVWVWIVRNGTPVGYSTNEYTISGSGTDTIISWQFNIDLGVGEYVELYWGADNVNVTIGTTAPTPPHPGIPANVVAVNFIAPLPSPRPVAP
jgi:hypothetical protein